jgi:DNA helicase-2/ATP-dependent DNA helicase PcrA
MSNDNFIDELVESLNKEQKQAVLSRNQHIRLLAGAGSGKTKVLTTRIAYLLSLGVEASSILAVTFTNKAAAEMKNRIETIMPKEMGININTMWVGTFHGLCNKIISAHHNLLNLPKNYEIIDTDDQKTIIRRVLEDLNISEDKKEVIKESLFYINSSKEKGLRPDDSSDYMNSLSLPMYYMNVYKRYEAIRISSNALDFGDILLYVKELFDKNPAVKKYYQDKFQHILVDEYQDTNDIQEEWLKNMSFGNYLYVVGDDDQSIYGWRGAKIDNIIDFKLRYPDSETIKLEQNYRSTNKILTAANTIIANNKKREGKNLWSDQDGGDNLTLRQCFNPEEEARTISALIKERIDYGENPKNIAILYRNNALSRAFESKLTEKMIPYKIVGGIGFWSRKEIKDVLSYLSMFNNNDNDISLERTINFPPRGIGKKTLQKVKEDSLKNNTSLYDSLKKLVDENEIKGKAALKIINYISIVEKGRKQKESVPYNLIMNILDSTDIENAYEKEGEEKSDERKLNIQELVYFARNFKNEEEDKTDLEAFLYHASLQSDADKQKDGDLVQLMTIHASKGLEFPYIYIVGFEEGVFPSKRSLLIPKQLEEERRLAYVAITRGEKVVDFSFCERRYNDMSEPSSFLSELPFNILDFKSNSEYGIYGIGKEIMDYKLNNSNIEDSEEYDKTPKPTKKASKYDIGDQISHKKFGKGIILNIYRKGDNLVAQVNFEFIGKKSLIIMKY